MAGISSKRQLLTRFQRDHSATSAIEFAILSPLFLFLLMGIAAYGIYFAASHSIQQIAADAARASIAGMNEGERQRIANSFIARNASGYAFVNPKKLSIETKDSVDDGSQFIVRLEYDARELPIWEMFRDLPLPGTIITRRSTIRVGGI